MEKILSQEEVDALLRGVTDGDIETEAPEVEEPQDGPVPYDLGNQEWVVVPGIGLIKGYAWGTLNGRFSLEYAPEEGLVEAGEYGLEYLKRLSSVWRTVAVVEGSGDAISSAFEAQWFVAPEVFAKFNIGFGLTPPADDFGYETGIVAYF